VKKKQKLMKNINTNKKSMFLSNIYLYVMYSRSYDYSIKNGGVHLISSVYSHPSLLNFETLRSFFSTTLGIFVKGTLLSSSGQFIIVRVVNDFDFPVETDGKNIPVDVVKTVNHSESLIEFILPLSILLPKLSGVSPIIRVY
jgi:hypothetical protein